MIRISVIVPVFNTEQYLSKCIESILCQTFKDFELILVDDGSTDKSGEICDYFESTDNRIKVIHKENGGAAKARNIGLEYASGCYTTFCDSDDYYSAYWIETLYNSMVQNDADCVSLLLNKQCDNYVYSIKRDDDALAYIVHRLLQSDGWEIWNRLYKTEIIKNHNVRFCTDCEDFGEDLSFNLQYCLYCRKIIALSGEGYHHITRKDSIMGANDKKLRFNALNEVSYSLFLRLNGENDNKRLKECYPLIHYLIIDNQYKRLIAQNRVHELKTEISKIVKKNWMKNMIKKYLQTSRNYKPFFIEDNEWKLSILKSHYLLHQNYLLLRIERKVKGLYL